MKYIWYIRVGFILYVGGEVWGLGDHVVARDEAWVSPSIVFSGRESH